MAYQVLLSRPIISSWLAYIFWAMDSVSIRSVGVSYLCHMPTADFIAVLLVQEAHFHGKGRGKGKIILSRRMFHDACFEKSKTSIEDEIKELLGFEPKTKSDEKKEQYYYMGKYMRTSPKKRN